MSETTSIQVCQVYGEDAAQDIMSGLRKAYGGFTFQVEVMTGFPNWRRVYAVMSEQKMQEALIFNKTAVYSEMVGFCNGWFEHSKRSEK